MILVSLVCQPSTSAIYQTFSKMSLEYSFEINLVVDCTFDILHIFTEPYFLIPIRCDIYFLGNTFFILMMK